MAITINCRGLLIDLCRVPYWPEMPKLLRRFADKRILRETMHLYYHPPALEQADVIVCLAKLSPQNTGEQLASSGYRGAKAGRIIGVSVCIVWRNLKNQKDAVKQGATSISEKSRRKGIGSQLLKFKMDCLALMGLSYSTEIANDNAASRKMAERAGLEAQMTTLRSRNSGPYRAIIYRDAFAKRKASDPSFTAEKLGLTPLKGKLNK